jgi:hypothetical protein
MRSQSVFPDRQLQFVAEKIASTQKNPKPTVTGFCMCVSFPGAPTCHSTLLEEWCLDILYWSTLRYWRTVRCFWMFSHCQWIPDVARVTRQHKGDSWHTTTVCAQEDCHNRMSGTTSARRNYTFGNYVTWQSYIRSTATCQADDIDSLLHVNWISLHREQFYLHLVLTVLCTSTILGFLCFSLRFRLHAMIWNCWIPYNTSPDTTEQNPYPYCFQFQSTCGWTQRLEREHHIHCISTTSQLK